MIDENAFADAIQRCEHLSPDDCRTVVRAYEGARREHATGLGRTIEIGDVLLSLQAIEGLPQGFNLQTIVDAIRPYLRERMPAADETIMQEGWNILRTLDRSEELLVCRHQHGDGEECEWETWVRKKDGTT